MNKKPIELAKDPDLRGAIAALHRAEAQAIRIAQQTGTRLIKIASTNNSNDQIRLQQNEDSQHNV